MSFPHPVMEIGSIPDLAAVRAVAPDLAAAAQSVYDGWTQDLDGLDDELGGGGICHLIADAFLPVLERAGVEHAVTMQAAVGENHVFVVALLAEGAVSIDVSPFTYERGSGYSWTKVRDVTIRADDVSIDPLSGPMTPDEFDAAYRD